MQAYLDPVIAFASERAWLVSANLTLSLLLFAWLLRYRRLYIRAASERESKHELIQNLAEGIYESSVDGAQISANPALVALNGYDTEAEMTAAVGDIATEWYVDPNRRAEFREILMRDGRVADFVSEVYRHKTRERIWVTESARLVLDPINGRPIRYEGSVRDITEVTRRLAVEERLEKLTSHVPGGFFQILAHADGTYSTLYTSAGLNETIGANPGGPGFEPSRFHRRIIEEDRQLFVENVAASTRELRPWKQEFRVRTDSGAIRWIDAFSTPEKAGDGGVIWHGYAQDITDRKMRELEIHDYAFYDGLTKLPNRRMLEDRLPQAIASADRRANRGAVLFIDLDDFKNVNDSYGHDIGDEYLTRVAERLRASVRRNDLVARMGGDEFVVLLEDVGRDDASARRTVRSIAEKVLSGLRAGFRIGQIHHSVSGSIGAMVFDGSETTGDEILKCADLAMYDAKGTGKNAINIFDPALLDQQEARYRLVRELNNAIAWGRIVLHYQPILDRNGTVVAAEALARWPHPTRGLLTPEDFIIIAERSGMISELTRHVLSCGIETLAAWMTDPRTAALRLGVNIPTAALLATEFPATLRRMILQHRIDPSRLTLELTEDIMSEEQDRVAERMAEVKALGVRFSLDDFGTGRSSLSRLKLYPFDEVKIDGDFVTKLETQDIGRMLVKTILAMAETLELDAVAEHVETERQLEFLRENGCDRFQGYLFAGPKNEADFLRLVRGEDTVSMGNVLKIAS